MHTLMFGRFVTLHCLHMETNTGLLHEYLFSPEFHVNQGWVGGSITFILVYSLNYNFIACVSRIDKIMQFNTINLNKCNN